MYKYLLIDRCKTNFVVAGAVAAAFVTGAGWRCCHRLSNARCVVKKKRCGIVKNKS